MRPLQGLLVLDFSTLLPGPFASLLLAEAGAEVIKVERPGVGDDMRAYEPNWGADSATFALLNRGKQSLTLDLKDSTARASLQPLIGRADILLEQFRPGVMARLGLDYDSVASINPRLIYCSISAYGQTGSRREDAGHDINLLAETGILALSRGDGGHATMPPIPIGDIAGGSYPAVINILLALQERERTGVGRHLDIALGDNLFALTYWALAQGWATGRFPCNRDHLVTGASPRYRLYTTRDGGIVAAAPLEPKFWTNLCELLSLDPALRDDARNPAATAAGVAAIIAAEEASTWSQRFASCDCCCSVAVNIEQALADPHFQTRGLFGHTLINERGKAMPALPVPIDPAFRAPAGTALAAPPLGSANANLLAPRGVTAPDTVAEG
jgi:alpha-methylacyl-CoA racemase